MIPQFVRALEAQQLTELIAAAQHELRRRTPSCADKVLAEVAAERNVAVGAITGPARPEYLVAARAEVAKRLKLQRKSLEQIGAVLNRDRATVRNLLRRAS